MEPENLNNDPREILRIIKESLLTYKANIRFYLTGGLILGFASEAGAVAATLLHIKSIEFIFACNLFLTSLVIIPLIKGTSHIYHKKQPNFLGLFKEISNYFTYVAVSLTIALLANAVVSSKNIFLIILVIYFSIIFIFVDVIVVLENTFFIESFRRSVLLVRGLMSKVILFFLFLVGLFVVPFAIIQGMMAENTALIKVLSVFLTSIATPVFIVLKIQLYYFMKELKKNDFDAMNMV